MKQLYQTDPPKGGMHDKLKRRIKRGWLALASVMATALGLGIASTSSAAMSSGQSAQACGGQCCASCVTLQVDTIQVEKGAAINRDQSDQAGQIVAEAKTKRSHEPFANKAGYDGTDRASSSGMIPTERLILTAILHTADDTGPPQLSYDQTKKIDISALTAALRRGTTVALGTSSA